LQTIEHNGSLVHLTGDGDLRKPRKTKR